jgi:ABC-type Fe3+/spermidine/putrescine transport system ATPase subunit
MSAPIAFEVHSVGKRYAEVTALTDLSLQIGQGERVALVGSSGAGKTTLLYLLAGVIVPDQGIVRAYGHDMAALRSPRERAELVGIMHQ